jgi:PadR family transcriptional regulator PadR
VRAACTVARPRRIAGTEASTRTTVPPHVLAAHTLYCYAYGFKPSEERAVHIDKDLVAASATPLVLAILAEGESYGYAILKRVRELSGGELEWTDGMLYPLLHRLRRLRYVTTEWRTPPDERRRRYYAITDDGRAALAEQQRQWVTVTRALGDVWRGSGGMPTALGEA